MSILAKTDSKILIAAITVYLYLPLLESIFPGTLWGLNWQSPFGRVYL
jgi:hypothetical protein